MSKEPLGFENIDTIGGKTIEQMITTGFISLVLWNHHSTQSEQLSLKNKNILIHICIYYLQAISIYDADDSYWLIFFLSNIKIQCQ